MSLHQSPAPTRIDATRIDARRLAAACAVAALAVATLAGCGGDAPATPPPEPSVATLVAGSRLPDSGYVGETILPRPVILALDAERRPMARVPVTFAVAAGGGTVERAVVLTDTNGVASQERWILGDVPGPNVVTASAGAASLDFRVRGVRRARPPWAWRSLGAPLGDREVGGVLVDPLDPHTLYVTSIRRGLYVSRDAGATWTLSLAGQGIDQGTFVIDPRDPRLLWAARTSELHVSSDRGRSWTLRARLPEPSVRSLHVGPRDGVVYVGVQAEGATPGIYRSTDGGRTFAHHSLGPPAGVRILPWQIAEDTAGTLYVGTEIADHPQPYHPQLFRSTDRGVTWTDATGPMPWHVLRIGIDPRRDRVLAMTEGAGLYASADRGTTWTFLGRPFGAALLVDPRDPDVLYGGELTLHGLPGGAYRSTDAGARWEPIGLPNRHVTALALTPAGDRLYAAAGLEGVWVAEVPVATP